MLSTICVIVVITGSTVSHLSCPSQTSDGRVGLSEATLIHAIVGDRNVAFGPLVTINCGHKRATSRSSPSGSVVDTSTCGRSTLMVAAITSR